MECQVGDLLVTWKTDVLAIVTEIQKSDWSGLTYATVWYPQEKREMTYDCEYIAEKLRKVTDGATFQSR